MQLFFRTKCKNSKAEHFFYVMAIDFLSDRTAARSKFFNDRLLASYRRLSVCRSVCDAVYSGAQGRWRGLKAVPSSYRQGMPIHVLRYALLWCIV